MSTPKKTVKKPEPDKQSCASCKFFALSEPKDDAGYCRRYPPKHIASDETDGWTFAIVMDDDWCGEYARKLQG